MQIGDKVRIIAEDCLDGSSGCRDLCNCHNSNAIIEGIASYRINDTYYYDLKFSNGFECSLLENEIEFITSGKLKLSELVEKIDKSCKNEAFIDFEDFDEFIPTHKLDYDKISEQTRLKACWSYNYLEDYEDVGGKVYFLDDKPIAISAQLYRKSDTEIGFFSDECFKLFIDYINTFLCTNTYSIIDLSSEVDKYYKLNFNSNLISDKHKAFYKGKPVQIMEKIKSKELGGILSNEVVILLDNETKTVKINELDFMVNINE